MEVIGRNLAEGIPVTFTMSSSQVYDAMLEPLSNIVQAIRSALELSPPELSADISERGIVLTGGGAKLRGLDISRPLSLAPPPVSTIPLSEISALNSGGESSKADLIA